MTKVLPCDPNMAYIRVCLAWLFSGSGFSSSKEALPNSLDEEAILNTFTVGRRSTERPGEKPSPNTPLLGSLLTSTAHLQQADNRTLTVLLLSRDWPRHTSDQCMWHCSTWYKSGQYIVWLINK